MTVTIEIRWPETARAEDASQAAYFREALAKERDSVRTDLPVRGTYCTH
jgi:hypothetical protein